MTNVFLKVTDQTAVAETTLTMNFRVEKDICVYFRLISFAQNRREREYLH